MKRLCSYALILLIVTSCAQIKSYPISNNTISSAGFYYALPKTYLNVAVTLQKIVTIDGIYSDYAECVGLPPHIAVAPNSSPEYKVKSATITNNVYLDNSKIYQLDINQKFLNKSEFSIEYATNGELASTNITNQNQIVPAIITTANIIKDIAGSASLLGFDKADLNGTICDNLPNFVIDDLKRLRNAHTSINTLLERGPDGLDQAQLEFRLKELRGIRDGIASKFTKTQKIKTVIANFEVDPSAIKANTPLKLFMYKKDKGVNRTYTTNLHDSVVPITDNLPFHNSTVSTSDIAVELHLVYLDKLVKTSIKSNDEDSKSAIGSFYYRIPAKAKFKVMVAGENIGEATLPIPQEGATIAAPSNLSNITFKLHPGLGSIYTVSGKSGDANFGDIDSLRKTLFTDKNEKTIKDLENKIKIRDLKDKLENGTTTSSEE
jgi:hypothetical protein